MKGRKWTAEEKLAIVLEGIKGARAVAEICREHQIAQTQYDQWRDRFLEGGQRALTNGVSASEEALRREIEKLQRLIGKQAVAIELLKKRTSWSGGGEAGGRVAGGRLVGGGSLPDDRAQSQRLLCRAAGGPCPGSRAGSLG
jgi:transposase-like protein